MSAERNDLMQQPPDLPARKFVPDTSSEPVKPDPEGDFAQRLAARHLEDAQKRDAQLRAGLAPQGSEVDVVEGYDQAQAMRDESRERVAGQQDVEAARQKLEQVAENKDTAA